MEKDLTLNKALEIANCALQGSKWCNQFSDKLNVNYSKSANFDRDLKFKPAFKKRENFKNESKSRKCYRCGSLQHVANYNKCPAVKITCNICKKVGHFAKFCLSQDKIHEVNKVDLDDSTNSLNVFPVRMVNTCSVKHTYIDVKV